MTKIGFRTPLDSFNLIIFLGPSSIGDWTYSDYIRRIKQDLPIKQNSFSRHTNCTESMYIVYDIYKLINHAQRLTTAREKLKVSDVLNVPSMDMNLSDDVPPAPRRMSNSHPNGLLVREPIGGLFEGEDKQ